MADTVSTKTRSRTISRVRSKDTGELAVRRVLWRADLRYRAHYRVLDNMRNRILSATTY